MEATHRTKVFWAFAAVYIVWGSTYFSVQIALKSFPVFMLSSIRMMIGGLLLAFFCKLRSEEFPSIQDIIKNGIIGLVIFIGGIVFVAYAQQYISSSLTSAVITTPFWFVILDKRQWKFYFSNWWIIAGLLVGFVGVILLMAFKPAMENSSSDTMQIVAILIVIAGSFLWASGSLYLKYNPTKTSIYVSTSIQLIVTSLVIGSIAFFSGEVGGFEISNVTASSIAAVIYLAIISSTITFLAYIWLIKVQPPAIVSTYAYINPVIATLLGWFFANENITVIQLLGLGVVLIGVLLVNVPRYNLFKK